MRLPRKTALYLAICVLCAASVSPAQAAVMQSSMKGPGVKQDQGTGPDGGLVGGQGSANGTGHDGGQGAGQDEAQGTGQDITQAIVVDETGGFQVKVSYYKKQADDTWTLEFEVPGIYGRNGGTDDKREGDGKTPYGVYSFTMAFGLKENPGSILPYHQIGEDDFWIDDSESVYYNRLVNAAKTERDWNSGEHMSRQGISYNYGLVLNYNEDCVPGRGSAIFLHCYAETNDSGSAGCIRIPEENMKQLIQAVDDHTRIVIRRDI